MRCAVALLAVLLGACGEVERRGDISVQRYDLESRMLGRTLPQVALVPEGEGRPLLVFLHGRTDDGHESSVGDSFLRALEGLGDAAPVVVFPNGGTEDEGSYWHDRASGDWLDYVLVDAIGDAQRRFGIDPARVAIGGISMGGFGAYSIARLAERPFCAVGGHSAALWRTGGETAPGAFDDAEDFARHDVIAIAGAEGRRPWKGAALWLDTGTEDPFRAADQALADALGIRLLVWEGEHGGRYWADHYDEYLRFYARALADC
jgi:poly(3-hydroxybutyrate) depolymerase